MNSITLDGLAGSGELWLDIMRIICGDTSDKSMVDLGCHKAPYTPLLGFKERTYVDIQDRPLDHIVEQQYFVQSDASVFLANNNKKYDVAICSDVLEHLTIGNGCGLVEWMQLRSKKQIIFTPLGGFNITYDGHPDSHASGWSPDLLQACLCIILPNFHPSLGIGAFFAVRCEYWEKQRIYNEIINKYVISGTIQTG